MASIFRIVLRDVKRYDTYETRQFDLPLNSTFAIGRASSSVTKKELMAAPHNAYIDSPVISRRHAVLSANSSTGVPEVYISDQGSMHGTLLNGQKLTPNTPTKLKYGDELQFGTDVNRNDEFFVARKYVFESQLIRPFSLGFTVPDAESEEEEVEQVPRRGSHADPVVIDDSDAPPDHSDEENEGDATIVMEDMLLQGEPAKPSRFGPDVYTESALRTTVVDDVYDEAEEAVCVPGTQLTSDDAESLLPHTPDLGDIEDDGLAVDTDFDSKAGSIDSSEMDSDSEDGIDEAEYTEPITAPATDGVPYLNSHTASASEQSVSTHQAHPPLREIYGFGGAGNAPPRLPCVDMFGLQPSNNSANAHAESSRAGMAKAAKIDRMPLCDDTAPPLPPRSSSRPASWGVWSYPPFSQNETQSWYQQSSYMGMDYEDQPVLFSPVPPAPAPEHIDAHPPTSFYQQPSQKSQAGRLQTPPPAQASEAEVITPLQPGRRTKVSIEEIVEEVVEEQPLTPESVNYRKRKAEVLEDETVVTQVEVLQKAPVTVKQAVSKSTNPVPVVDAAATQTATQIAQRPKKTPRSVLGKVLNKAAYPLLGATGAVISFALLSTLPDTFFL